MPWWLATRISKLVNIRIRDVEWNNRHIVIYHFSTREYNNTRSAFSDLLVQGMIL